MSDECYALANPKGEIVKISQSLENVVNHFPINTYTTELWNVMFHADAEERIKLLASANWVVSKGYYTQRIVLS